MVACGEIDMHPRRIVLDEFSKKTAGQYVVGRAFDGTLLYVGCIAFEILQKTLYLSETARRARHRFGRYVLDAGASPNDW